MSIILPPEIHANLKTHGFSLQRLKRNEVCERCFRKIRRYEFAWVDTDNGRVQCERKCDTYGK